MCWEAARGLGCIALEAGTGLGLISSCFGETGEASRCHHGLINVLQHVNPCASPRCAVKRMLASLAPWPLAPRRPSPGPMAHQEEKPWHRAGGVESRKRRKNTFRAEAAALLGQGDGEQESQTEETPQQEPDLSLQDALQAALKGQVARWRGCTRSRRQIPSSRRACSLR